MADEALRFVDWSWKPVPKLPADLFTRNDIWRLDLINCGTEELPDAIGNLTRLRTLYANWCRLRTLPESIGRLVEL